MANNQFDKNGFSFIWKIENYRMSAVATSGYIKSPKFVIDMLNNSKWVIKLYPWNKGDKNCIGIGIEKIEGQGKTSVSISLSFLTINGEFFLGMEEKKKINLNGSIYKYFEHITDGIILKNSSFLPNETLSLRCHFWNGSTAPQSSIECSAVTHVKVEKLLYQWCLSGYSKITANNKVKFTIKSPSPEAPKFDIYFSQGEKYMDATMQIVEATRQMLYVIKTKISIVDVNGDYSHVSENEKFILPDDDLWHFSLNLIKKEILKQSELYLPKDVLTLHCELDISNSKMHSRIYKYNTLIASPMATTGIPINIPECNNEFSIREEGILSLLEDLTCLLFENKCSDVIIKANGKKFRAHKAILCARSPVFYSMFESNMIEKQSGLVDISDMDTDVMSIFLKYIYTGQITDWDWKTAISLYSASDKYQITSLKRECFSYLSGQLNAQNVCEVLVLADMHQDENLQQVAKDVFCIHSKTVLLSEEWINILKNKPDLASSLLREMALRMQ